MLTVLLRLLRGLGIALLVIVLSGLSLAALGALVVIYAYPKLPSLSILTHYQPDLPLRVYTAEGILIGEFGDERRVPLKLSDVPIPMRQAILAAEDSRFYEHPGVDWKGVARALMADLRAGSKVEGASTITMQVARNFFLSNQKSYSRKFNETLLAIKIDRELSKDQILELYINQIFLGQHAYGFAAASRIYFGRPLKQLSLAEMAMLAGLPKSPSAYNPISSPGRAKARQMLVLGRMRVLGYINEQQYREAADVSIDAHLHLKPSTLPADYVAEMVRQDMVNTLGEAAYRKGLRVYTTIRRRDQEAAYRALRQGAFTYDRRHRYRGPEGTVDLPPDAHEAARLIRVRLKGFDSRPDLLPVVVTAMTPHLLTAVKADGEVVRVVWESGWGFGPSRSFSQLAIQRGSVVRIRRREDGQWGLTQWPQAEAALVAMDPDNGSIRALVGGFDFQRNQYNHVTLAARQPGSSFKPFVYSAALDKGYTPATLIDDAPLYFSAKQTGSRPWAPQNYEHNFSGPITLRRGLRESRNLVAIRVLQSIGIDYARGYLSSFGIDPESQPPYLSMVLGAGPMTPIELTRAYATFANGGYLVRPFLVQRVVDRAGNLVYWPRPAVAGINAPQAIHPRNAFLMTSLLQDVVRHGTATRAMQLGRHDLAGKTGTTEDHVDTWFAGYQRHLVAVSWLGFDHPQSLGAGETGAKAALPIWMDYMKEALRDVPEELPPIPEGVVSVSIDPATGLRSNGPDSQAYYFFEENQPLYPTETPASAPFRPSAEDAQ